LNSKSKGGRKRGGVKARKGGRRMQMADLARLAGVSPSTVSRALQGSELVSARTRERIQALARKHNYTVNSTATSLRSGTNRTIAVVVPYEPGARQSFADPFFHGMIASLADALTERGHEMLLVRIDADKLDSAAALVDAGRVAGIILIGQWHHHDQLNAMADRDLPLVVWGSRLPDQRYTVVGGDNVHGGELVAEHLLGQGCRRILFLGNRDLPEVAQRYRGFMAAHRRRGVTRPAALNLKVPFLPGAGGEAVRSAMARGVDFDAVFATSDLLAMSAVATLRECGHGVPGEIPVVGYDDVELAALFNPPLSSVSQPLHEGAGALVEALIDKIGGGNPPAHTLPARLVVRASSRLNP
jgi:DNA-binding LacI/PurR family transcriptional regulator